MIIGLISGACGPFTNGGPHAIRIRSTHANLPGAIAPIDTIKTRIQRATALPGETAWSRVTTVAGTMFKEEGFQAFYSA